MLRIAIVIALVGSLVARADEGESSLSVSVSPEVAWLSHPLTAEVSPFTPTGTFSFLPRLGVGLRYGLTDSLTLGFGVDSAGFFGLNAVGTRLENTVGTIVTGTYFDAMAPLSLAYRVDAGYDASAAAARWPRAARVAIERAARWPLPLPVPMVDTLARVDVKRALPDFRRQLVMTGAFFLEKLVPPIPPVYANLTRFIAAR
jgi:hypothetical protein